MNVRGEHEEGNGGADICACWVINRSRRGGASSTETGGEKEGRAPDSKPSSKWRMSERRGDGASGGGVGRGGGGG